MQVCHVPAWLSLPSVFSVNPRHVKQCTVEKDMEFPHLQFHTGNVYESSPVTLLPLPEKLAQAKEENLDMHQVLDQTLLELNNL